MASSTRLPGGKDQRPWKDSAYGIRRVRERVVDNSGPEFNPNKRADGFWEVLDQLGFDSDVHVEKPENTAKGGAPLQSQSSRAPFTITKE